MPAGRAASTGWKRIGRKASAVYWNWSCWWKVHWQGGSRTNRIDPKKNPAHSKRENNKYSSILKETRNIVLHEGDFWSIQLFNSREDCGLLSSIQSKKTNIKNEIKNIQLQYCDEESKVYFEKHDSLIKLLNSSSELVYFFNTTIDFKKFTAIFVRACVNFITNYINTNLSTTEGRWWIDARCNLCAIFLW